MPPDRFELTDDGILDGRLKLLQPRRGHRFGHDAILLAAAVSAKPGQRVAEFGAGVGAASLALLARVDGLDATLLEIDAALCALAGENIARNGFADRARAIAIDVTAPLADFEAAGIRQSFDHIFMNPPFNDARLQPSPDAARRKAHAGDVDLLGCWLDRAGDLLSEASTVTLIWRAEAQDDVLEALAKGFGAMTIIPVHPASGRPAIRVIVSGMKGGNAPLRQLPALTLNDSQNRPSADAEAILRRGGAWPPPG